MPLFPESTRLKNYADHHTEEEAVLEEVVWTDLERMSGTPCFYGTRVPVKNLFDYLEGGPRASKPSSKTSRGVRRSRPTQCCGLSWTAFWSASNDLENLS